MKEAFDKGTIVETDIEYIGTTHTQNVKRVSISGVQDKLFALMDNGKLRLVTDGEQSRYIIKPIPDNHALMNRIDMPANEYLTMQIAKQLYGIETASNGLIRMKDGRLAYIAKRFDVTDEGQKLYQEDMASVMGKTGNNTEYKYTGSYLGMGLAMKAIFSTWRFELPKYLQIVLFNYLFANGDAHIKNFSICRDKNGGIVLTPAYDLINTSIHINDSDFALSEGLGTKTQSDIMERTGHPTLDDFIALGKELGLNEKHILKAYAPFTRKNEIVREMCDASYLSDKAKRMFIASYEQRLARLLRE